MAETLKEGRMFKRGKLNKEWKLRTFILNASKLSYFKGGNPNPAGFIELTEIQEILPFDISEGIFQVSTPRRVYEFKGETREETLEWRQAIIDTCLDANIKIKL